MSAVSSDGGSPIIKYTINVERACVGSAVVENDCTYPCRWEPDGKSRWQDMCVVSKSSYEINITDVDQSMISISDIEHGRDYYAFVTAHNAVGAGERWRSDVKVTALGHPSKPKLHPLTIRQGVANIKIAALDDDGGVAATILLYTTSVYRLGW